MIIIAVKRIGAPIQSKKFNNKNIWTKKTKKGHTGVCVNDLP